MNSGGARASALAIAGAVVIAGVTWYLLRPRVGSGHLACIGAYSCGDQMQRIESELKAKGIPLTNDGLCDVGATSMMVPVEYRDRAIAAVRELQLRHPDYYLDLMEDVHVAFVSRPNYDAVTGALRARQVHLSPPQVEKDQEWVTVRRSDREAAVKVLEKIKAGHPGYRLEIFPDANL